MKKIDKQIINNIKLMSLEMINRSGRGQVGEVLSMTPLIYAMYVYHLNIDPKNPKYINRDRVIYSNNYLTPVIYSTLHMCGYNIGLEDLKDYGRINSITPRNYLNTTPGIEVSTSIPGSSIATSVGVALSERYLSNLIKNIDKKNNLLDYNTYVICNENDLFSAVSYEALSTSCSQNLNKLTIIYEHNNMNFDGEVDSIYPDYLLDRLLSLDIEHIRVKNGDNINDILSALKKADNTDSLTLIEIDTILGKDSILEGSNKLFNTTISDNDYINLKNKYNISNPFEPDIEYYSYIEETINKRNSKYMSKWNELYKVSRRTPKINGIIELLENNDFNIEFNSDNYKLSDNYEEDIRTGNNKIFNLFASKSDFNILITLDSINTSKMIINKDKTMTSNTPLNKNLVLGRRELSAGFIAAGLSLSNLKVFISTELSNLGLLYDSIRLNSYMNNPVNYIFTSSYISDINDGGLSSNIEGLNLLNSIPNLINITPADINEVIGSYELISKHKRCFSICIGSSVLKKLPTSNPKYVSFGAYRIKRENASCNAIFISSGTFLAKVIKYKEELITYGIDARVVSMPSKSLFELQNVRYLEQLLPKCIKTFVFTESTSDIWNKYATSSEYIFSIDKYIKSGTYNEVINDLSLDDDEIKSRIITLMKDAE